MRIYVASSWRNQHQQAVVADLRDCGHDVYDFRNPAPGDNGFSWRQIEPGWEQWTPEQYRRALQHPIAMDGFNKDFHGMLNADACVLVLPCGRSAHLEAGWLCGRGKPLHVLVPADYGEPDLMYLLAGSADAHLHTSMRELLDAIGTPWTHAQLRHGKLNPAADAA